MPLYWEKQDNGALPLDSMGIMSYPFQSRWQYIYIQILHEFLNFWLWWDQKLADPMKQMDGDASCLIYKL